MIFTCVKLRVGSGSDFVSGSGSASKWKVGSGSASGSSPKRSRSTSTEDIFGDQYYQGIHLQPRYKFITHVTWQWYMNKSSGLPYCCRRIHISALLSNVVEKKDKEKEMGSSHYQCVSCRRKGGSSKGQQKSMVLLFQFSFKCQAGFVGIMDE